MSSSPLRVARGILNQPRPSRALPTTCGFCGCTDGVNPCPQCGTTNPGIKEPRRRFNGKRVKSAK